MDHITISAWQLFAMFPDQESARTYLEARRWPEGVRCPVCTHGERIATRQGGYYRCHVCAEDFTVRTGTVFERSHVPLHKWVYAMDRLVTSRKGIASLQLSKEIGITQKSAWFLLQRLREACGNQLEVLRGIVEVDESYFGGTEGNKHESKKLRQGRGPVGKTAVLGMRERGGRTVAMPVSEVDRLTIHKKVYVHIEPGTKLYSDEHAGYLSLHGLFYQHETVNHSVKEYVRGEVSTNSIESVWAVMKRGIQGVYHHASAKHLGRYVNEFTFRLNDGNVQRHTLDRLDSFIAATANKRLTYKELTA